MLLQTKDDAWTKNKNISSVNFGSQNAVGEKEGGIWWFHLTTLYSSMLAFSCHPEKFTGEEEWIQGLAYTRASTVLTQLQGTHILVNKLR